MGAFYCPSCKKQHSIGSAEAEQSCRELMGNLELTGRLDFEQSLANPVLSTTPLFGEARGQMFGILICAPAGPGEPKIILKAFSGQYNGIWEIPGWVPPILAPSVFTTSVAAADPPIKALGARISELPIGAERNALIEERKTLSQRHMLEIHEMYSIGNFKGESTSLFTLFGKQSGIPAGTGDCCGPKLLSYAALRGLKPLSLAEFFWGRENRSQTKVHRKFYQPCDDKCRPILGYMLCGADNVA